MRLVTSILFLVATGCGAGVQSEPALGMHQCNAPDGPMHDYSTTSELSQLIAGTWVHCSGPTLMGAEEQGIEFLAGGTYYVLISDGEGGLVRETGFDGQGTWVGLQLTPTSVEFAWDNTSHTGEEGTIAFEDTPQKLLVSLGESSIYALFP
jgi:hypothetical protein